MCCGCSQCYKQYDWTNLKCQNCNKTNTYELNWWILIDDEIDYLLDSYKENKNHQTAVLFCKDCLCVGFPGVENSLLKYENGKLLNPKGKEMLESSYRPGFQHISATCENQPLEVIKALLSPELRRTIKECGKSTLSNCTFVGDFTLSVLDKGPEYFTTTERGLYLRPFEKNSITTYTQNLCNFIGRMMSISYRDQRMINLPLSNTFYKLLFKGLPSKMSYIEGIYDIMAFDSTAGTTLLKLYKFYEEIMKIKNDLTISTDKKLGLIEQLKFDGVKLEDLAIDFTLPGYPNIELIPDGKNVILSNNNIEVYIKSYLNYWLNDGVALWFHHIKKGFSNFLDILTFKQFPIEDIHYFFHGEPLLWTVKELTSAIKCDHGYTSDSPVIGMLIECLVEFTPEQQRKFLQFSTGSPLLPIGGLINLKPQFTVVKRVAENYNPNETLPTASVCFNYLKLPEYSSKEILKEKLLLAISEGGTVFTYS